MGNVDRALANYLGGPGPHKLELGAGFSGKPGWLATDLESRQQADGSVTIRMDATKRFPFEDATFDYLYCEHMIEHIEFISGFFMLRECHRVLKPGGVVRVVTPSLGFLLRMMSSDKSQFERTYLEWAVKESVPNAPITNAVFFNNFVRAWGHLFIYDRQTLELVMRGAGFAQCAECGFNDSEHADLRGLENAGRMPPGYLELESMVYEGTK